MTGQGRRSPTCWMSASVDELITSRALRHPAFRLVQDGDTLPRAGYTTSRRWGATRYEGVIDPARAVAALADGATLVLQALHTNWAPLGPLLRLAARRAGPSRPGQRLPDPGP